MRFKFFTHLSATACAGRIEELKAARILEGKPLDKGAIVIDEASEFGVRLHRHESSLHTGLNLRLKAKLERYRGGTLVSGSIGLDAGALIVICAAAFLGIFLLLLGRYLILKWIYHGHIPPAEPSHLPFPLWLFPAGGFGLWILARRASARRLEQPLEDFIRRHLEAEKEMR